MNQIMRYVGIMLVLIGVIVLALYFFGVVDGNGVLGTAAVFLVAGMIGHIILNKIFQDGADSKENTEEEDSEEDSEEESEEN